MKAKLKSGLNENVKYTLHDSDDEDLETQETRRSLRTAEKMLNARFFTNNTDRDLYNKRKADGTLRKEVATFNEKDDNVTATEEEVKAKEQDKKVAKAITEKTDELQADEEKAKKKAD